LDGIERDLLDNLDLQLKTLLKQKNIGELDENDIISSLIDDCDNLKKELEKSNNINLKLRNMIKNTEMKIQGYNDDIKTYKSDMSKHSEEVRRYKDEIEDKNKLIENQKNNHNCIQEIYSKLKYE